MRPAPVLLAAVFAAALLAPIAGFAAGCPSADPACDKASALSTYERGLYARQVPLSQAGDWAVAPKLSRRLVQVTPGIYVALKGDRERRHARVARWIEGLRGAPRSVFEREGMPVYRYRELAENHLFEMWTYPERHLTYVFEGDRLVGTEPF